MMKYAGAVVLALAVVTVRLDAQANDDRLRGLFDPPTYASLHAVLDSARTAGLPTEPLIDKALEGSAKHASSDRIVTVVRDLSARLADTRTALGGYGTADELSAGTAALRAGIAPATLADLRRLRHNEQVTIPLAVAAELVARGVRPDSASAQVLRLAAAGAPDVELAALPHSLASPSVASSMSPTSGTALSSPTALDGAKSGPVEAGNTKRSPQRP
ncbi:MAG TPA: hypothetical protein VNV25_16775 [Gemmatimonadaceae bacterium]|jgi:hypothetical protein|nr:hypothetical protein [Gemmatimonadaceae bacterium]